LLKKERWLIKPALVRSKEEKLEFFVWHFRRNAGTPAGVPGNIPRGLSATS